MSRLPSHAHSLATAGLLLLLCAALYHPSSAFFFYSDDFVFLERSQLESPRQLGELFSVERSKQGLLDKDHSYRPVSTNLYFGALQALFGPEPAVFHGANLLLLVLNAMLLLRLLGSLGLGRPLALLAAFLYPVSVVQFHSQLWLSVCQELLLVGFLLAAFDAYLGWAKSNHLGRYLAALVLYLLALLSKETAIVLPLLLLLYHLLLRRDSARRIVRGVAPFILLNLVYLGWRSLYFSIPSEGPYALKLGPFILENLLQYFLWGVEGIFHSSHALLGLASLVAALAGIAGASAERRALALFGAAWFLAFLLPVVFMADHVYRYYVALPLVGLLLLGAALLEGLRLRKGGRRIAAVVAVAYIMLFASVSFSKYRREAAELRPFSEAVASTLGQLPALCPEPPPGSVLLFVLPAGFPGVYLLKNRGAALRRFHAEGLLAGAIAEEQLGQIGFRPNLRYAIFRLEGSGPLRDLSAPWVPADQRACRVRVP